MAKNTTNLQDQPVSLTQPPAGYAEWLGELKERIHNAQQRATLAVNRELVLLYWQIGCDILARQASQGWGAKVIDRLAHDLRNAFPEMTGFSPRNLKYMRAVAEAWPEPEFVQQAAAQLPWGHKLVLLPRLKQPEQRLAKKITTPVRAELVEALRISIRSALRQAQGERKNLAQFKREPGVQPDQIMCAHSVRFSHVSPKRSVRA